MNKARIRREYRNEIINKLWTFNNIPKEAQKLMTEDDVQFMVEIIKIYADNCVNIFRNGKAIIVEIGLDENGNKKRLNHNDHIKDLQTARLPADDEHKPRIKKI